MDSILNTANELRSQVEHIEDANKKQEVQMILKQLESVLTRPKAEQRTSQCDSAGGKDMEQTAGPSSSHSGQKQPMLPMVTLVKCDYDAHETDSDMRDHSATAASSTHLMADTKSESDEVPQSPTESRDSDYNPHSSDDEPGVKLEKTGDNQAAQKKVYAASMSYNDTCKLCEVLQSRGKPGEQIVQVMDNGIKMEPSSLSIYECVIHLTDHLQASHLRQDDSVSQRNFIECPLCPKKYFVHGTTKSCYNYVVFHLSKAHGKQVFPRDFSVYTCDQCTFQTLRARDVKRHKSVRHGDGDTKNRGQPCPECGKLILRTSLPLHLATIHGAQDVPARIKERTELFECPECNKKFRGLGGLERHVKCIHNKIKEQLCHLCSQAFFAKRELELHLFSCHKVNISRSKVLKCEVDGCTYETLAKRHLDIHGAVHKTTKDLVCDVCGKAFKNQPALRQHFRIMHNTETEYQCSMCSFKSHAKQYVTRHMVIHSDVKQHKCRVAGCNYETHFIENLNKHKKKHLKE